MPHSPPVLLTLSPPSSFSSFMLPLRLPAATTLPRLTSPAQVLVLVLVLVLMLVPEANMSFLCP